MSESSASYHEPMGMLNQSTLDMHRALVSLQEELEAVDWYQQRADVCHNKELKAILLHNLREEWEHAAMVLEWLRRNSPTADEKLRTYLYTEQPIVEVEEGGNEADPGKDDGRTVGSLKEKDQQEK